MLLYKVERRSSFLLVRLELEGSPRRLYLDTLKAFAKKEDLPALSLLSKIHLRGVRHSETLLFDRIEVPLKDAKELLGLMKKTGRMIEEGKKEEEDSFHPPTPELHLTETSGSFANLWMNYGCEKIEFSDFSPHVGKKPRLRQEEEAFEKDLLDTGFVRKVVGKSSYFCPKEKVKEALLLLLEFGWKLLDPFKEQVSQEIHVFRKDQHIHIRSQLKALIDPSLQMQGVWKGDTLVLDNLRTKALESLLSLGSSVQWEDSILKCLQGLQEGAVFEEVSLSQRFKGNLLPYQKKGVAWLFFLYQSGFSALLSDEMGLGKTVQVLAFLSQLETNLPVLIVAPTSLLFQWEMEIDKFLSERGNIRIISYSSLRTQDLSDQSFEVIILDESSAIKTTKTQVARAAYKLRAKMKICLNGTPMENRADELFSQFHFLMPGFILSAESLSRELIRPFVMRRKKEDVGLELPEKIEQLCWVGMTEEQKALYEEVRSSSEHTCALEKIVLLRQMANDPRLAGKEVQGAKISRVIEDLYEVLQEKRKVLIFSQFTSMLQLIHQSFPTALYLDGATPGGKRKEIVQTFQNDEDASIFLLSLKAGGVGLNLTAADYIFMIDPWWNEAVESQAIARAHRIGRENKVIAKRYVMLGTIEENILKLKEKKLLLSGELLNFENEDLTEQDFVDLLSMIF